MASWKKNFPGLFPPPVVCQYKTDIGQILAGYADRTCAKIDIKDFFNIVVNNAWTFQQIGQRPVFIAGSLFWKIYGLIHIDFRISGQFSCKGQKAVKTLLICLAVNHRAHLNGSNINHRINMLFQNQLFWIINGIKGFPGCFHTYVLSDILRCVIHECH